MGATRPSVMEPHTRLYHTRQTLYAWFCLGFPPRFGRGRTAPIMSGWRDYNFPPFGPCKGTVVYKSALFRDFPGRKSGGTRHVQSRKLLT